MLHKKTDVLFAGGGGSSLGIRMATGRDPDIAVNHDPQAIAMHEENHPGTKHFIEDVFDVIPTDACKKGEVSLLWLSPDCKHFSKAKGAKPVSCGIRSLAWVGVRWATEVRPDVVILENVEEFKTWGPLDDNGEPIKDLSGETFDIYVKSYERLGYKVEWRELVASDYGAPTIRKRLFMIARCDGKPIVWPEPTHGDPKKYPDRIPWVPIADCIDWDIPSYSIFLNKEEGKKYGIKRPLAQNTLQRIARGIKKFIIDNRHPFLKGGYAGFVSTYYGGKPGSGPRGSNVDGPVGTITSGGSRHSIVTAFIAQHNLGNTGREAGEPLSTITTTGSQQQLVTAKADYIAKADTEEVCGHRERRQDVNAFVMKYYGKGEGSDIKEPAHTVTTRERFAIVEIHGIEYEIVDVCMRMFTPRELYRAQGFPDTYKIDIEYNGKKLPKTAQVRMCGNSVVPQVAKAIVEANMEKEVAYG
jgi:DNA (cytosine-5)-methyltransferase 1